MQYKVTERSANSLGWHDKPYIIWDCELKGFGVSVWGPGSSRAYVVQTKRHGKSFRKTLGTVGEMKAEEARARAIAFKGQVRDGRDPRAEERAVREAWTLQDAMNYYLGTYSQARKLAEGTRTQASLLWRNQTPDRWKSMRLKDITHPMVVARHREITGGLHGGNDRAPGGSRRANMWLAVTSRLFTLGIQLGHCTLNPTSGIKRNEQTERERFLSAREIATLWTYLEKHRNVEAAVLVQFILLTGCRPGEAYTMHWLDLDKDTATWTKPQRKTKQRKRHVVKLTAQAMAVLNRLDTWKRSAYVFPCTTDASQPRNDQVRAFWLNTCKNCGFQGVRLYDCRHSFASWLAMGGASELEIAAQLGHAPGSRITQRYIHLAQDHLREKAGIMGDVIARALADHPIDQQPLVAERRKDGSVTEHLRAMVITPETFAPWPELPEDKR